MRYIISRFNHDISWIPEYTDEYVLYDRSFVPAEGAIVVPNIGSDLYDKFSFIVDNYFNLPEVAVYTKANIFKYITPREFNEIKDNTTFTPILTKLHRTYLPICYYDGDGMFNEINNRWYVAQFPPPKHNLNQIMLELGIYDKPYLKFAPGSNYIIPKENILQHPRDFYQKLRSYLDYDVYPVEAQILERSLYYIFNK